MLKHAKLKPSDKASPARVSSIPLNEWIVGLIDKGEIDNHLYEIAYKLAAENLRLKSLSVPARSTSKRSTRINAELEQEQAWRDDAMDLAGDFLLCHVKMGNLRWIYTWSELKLEFSRYVTKRNNPERHELWEIMSEAIHSLAIDGKAIRIDADHTTNNVNTAIWVARGIKAKSGVCDEGKFARTARKKVGQFYPCREAGRVISPTDAAKLVEQLLSVAGAPISFQGLVMEARHHVVLSMQNEQAIADEQEADDDNPAGGCVLTAESNEDLMVWIAEEAPQRATAVWIEVLKQNNDKILCLYFIPKHYFGQKTTLSQFGTSQRVGEQSLEIKQVLDKYLKLDRLPSDGRLNEDDTFSKALLYLAGRVTELLTEKCSENGWNVPLTISNGRRGDREEINL